MPPRSTGRSAPRGPTISTRVFGGVLDYDGAGYYPGLELLNLVFGAVADELLPTDDSVRFMRRAHDFARRLVWDDGFLNSEDVRKVLYDDTTDEAIRHLLECLQLPIPSAKARPSWERAHFFPYTPSLIHWDARERRNRLIIERRYLRGGGALAYRTLRKDHDTERLDRCRKGFEALFAQNSSSALEQLAAVLAANGKSEEVARDDIERQALTGQHDDLNDLYRDGTMNILEHAELSVVSRIKCLMTWTAFWLVLIQHSRASAFLGRGSSLMLCDCGPRHAQLRRASQRCLKDLQAMILEAAEHAAQDDGASLTRQQRNKIRGFFWATAATIKLLNAWRGRRHFTLGLEILEALVLAGTSGAAELTFDDFVEGWLFDRCRLVVGRRAAEKAGILGSIDASIFEDNENCLADQMKAAGFLTEYSDATRMVSTGRMA